MIYQFKRYNALGAANRSDLTVEPHMCFLPYSEIAVCLEAGGKGLYSDRVFSLAGAWEITQIDELLSEFDSDNATFIETEVPAKGPASALFPEPDPNDKKGKCYVYRANFEVFDKNHRNFLLFERVGGDFEVYVNGKYMGATRLGFAEFDVSDAVSAGSNELLVRVSPSKVGDRLNKASDTSEGIFGEVKLKVRRESYMRDYMFTSERDGANYNGVLTVYAEGEEGTVANVIFVDGDEIIYEKETFVEDGKAEISVVGPFETYSAENPHLYHAYVRIMKDGNELECTKIPFGFGTLSAIGDKFMLDGVEVTLKGAVYESGYNSNYLDELAIMKEFNMNAVWAKGFVPMEFYDDCAEMGLYVIRELPFEHEEIKAHKISKHNRIEDPEGYMTAIASRIAARSKACPAVVGYSFGELTSTPDGKQEAEKIGRMCAKPVVGINIGVAPGAYEDIMPCIRFIPADSVTPDETESAVDNPKCAGVFIDTFKGKENALFDENGVERPTAIIAKYAYRPYSCFLADNRTLLIRNNYAFKVSDGLTVTVSLVKGAEENVIQRIQPVIAPGQTRDFGIYIGEYDEHTKIYVKYEEDGRHLATEVIIPKKEEILPAFVDSLTATSSMYTVKNQDLTLEKPEENAMPKRSYFSPCSSETVCNLAEIDGQSSVSDRCFSLNGEWDFSYFRENAPATFGGDTMTWKKVVLPASWESTGYEPLKYNKGYTFEPDYKKFTVADKKKSEDKNAVGIYRKFVNIGDNEFGYILSFAKVSGGLELQVNGKYVGYSLLGAAEFDITEYLDLGENEIVVIVKKRTQANYLFGADGFAVTGIVGDVRLVKYRKGGLKDYTVSVKKVGAEYAADINLKFFTEENAVCKIELKKDGETVYEKIGAGKEGEITFPIAGAFAEYNVETKEYYDLYVKVVEKNFVTECTRIPVGFNEVSIIGDVLRYNGAPIKIRGVLYNPVYNADGNILSLDEVKRDFEIIKSYGFNAVQAPFRFIPELEIAALKEGLLVVGNAGIDTSPAGEKNVKNRNAVMNSPIFEDLTVKVVLNELIPSRNMCNRIIDIIAENGDTLCVGKCVEEIKKVSSNPVFCLAGGAGDGLMADFPAINEVVDLINASAESKPVFFSRYGYATGIGCATMNEYEELIEGTSCCLGGCIASFTDDVIKGVGRSTGGLFTATREPYPGVKGIKYLYKPVRSELNATFDALEIINTRNYLSTDDLALQLKVMSSGRLMSTTRIDVDVPPKSSKIYDVFVGHVEGDMFLNVEYFDKASGKLLYTEQHVLSHDIDTVESSRGANPLETVELFDYLEVKFDCGTIRFNKRLGSIVSYTLNGKELLKTDSVHKGGNAFVTNIRRPFVRNLDGKAPVITSKPKAFSYEIQATGVPAELHVDIQNVLSLDGKESYIVKDKYIVKASGEIELLSVLTPLKKNLPSMDCFGKQLRFRNSFGNVVYYGNGVSDNYIDLCEHTRVGIFGLNVDKTFAKLPILQECGNRTNVRYAVVRDNDGDGMVISCKKVPYQLRVSPYSDGEIAKAYESGEKPKQSGVYVDVNAFVSGIGASENGYPMPQYVVGSGEHVMNVTFSPIGK